MESTARSTVVSSAGVYPMIEAAFELPDVTGNPFDDVENDIQVTLALPHDQTVTVPAFFDGDTTWRVRYTPHETGKYTIKTILRNGKPATFQHLTPPQFTVSGKPMHGFVRVDPKNTLRFAFEDGTPYYPIGNNAAWKSGDTPDIPELFAHMGAVGENWSRVWMNAWDNKNLDWPVDEKLATGQLSLKIARHWDAIVRAAEQNGIYFQMTLQHHGQYSSTVNPNWQDNPWNQKNGGFLATPEEFFTSEQAKRLTKAKYRYIIARWGYSPNVLAWELFNEVQFTDAVRKGQMPAVAAWHREMAAFLREQDIQRHLVTTSSDTDLAGLYDAMDYLQPHSYPPDVVAVALNLHPQEWNKPIFYGEIGPGGDLNADNGSALHQILWASVLSEASGAAQYWAWDNIHRRDLYKQFPPVIAFVKAAGLTEHPDMKRIEATVETPGSAGSITFAPGGGWGALAQRVFPIQANGTVDGIAKMPSFLQGKNHAEMFPSAEFPVTLTANTVFTVRIAQSAKAGAHVVLRRDGEIVTEKNFPAADSDTPQSITLSLPLPPGKHTIRLENTGQDWVNLGPMTLSPFGATLQAAARGDSRRSVLWLRNTRKEGASKGTVMLPGLEPGKYRLVWWDTTTGKSIGDSTVDVASDRRLTLTTPEITTDIAAYLQKK